MNAAVPGVLQWIAGGTSDALLAGMDGSSPVTVCRGQVGSELVPGKRVGAARFCDVPVRGAELLDATFDSLRNNARLLWVAGNATAAAEAGGYVRVDGGSWNTVRATVCRALHPSGSGPHSGYTDGLSYGGLRLCFFSWGGQTLSSAAFDVLFSLPPPSATPTPSRSPSPTQTPVSATPTPTRSPSPPPPSPSGTPSQTRTPTSSVTPTASKSVGASMTSTASVSPSNSASAAPPPPIDAGLYITDPKSGGASGIVLAALALSALVAAVGASAVFCRRAPPSAAAAAIANGAVAAGSAGGGAGGGAGGSGDGERQALSAALEFGSAGDARFAYDALASPGR